MTHEQIIAELVRIWHSPHLDLILKAGLLEAIEVLKGEEGDFISRQDAIRWVKTECNPYGKPTLDFESGKKVIEHLEQIPSAEQVTGKLKNPCDSLLISDSDECKEQKSKLESAADTFCKSQLITCNRVKECNDNCPFEDALKHADKEMDEQNVIDHDRDWIIGCLQHDGFIHTHRFDKANQIILDALSAEAVQGWIPVSEMLPERGKDVLVTRKYYGKDDGNKDDIYVEISACYADGEEWHGYSDEYKMNPRNHKVVAWMPLPTPYKGGEDE